MEMATRVGLCTYVRRNERRKKQVKHFFISISRTTEARGTRARFDYDTDTISQTKHSESGGKGGEVPSVRKVPEGDLDGNSSPVG